MAADLAGNQWNEGDVSCSVVRRVVIPDSFYVLDGLLHTFMTILNEFGIFEENIKNELSEQLPLLATTKILMECVKSGMGREVAYKLIKKHFNSRKLSGILQSLANDKDFPMSVQDLMILVNEPTKFAGLSVQQTTKTIRKIQSRIQKKDLKFKFEELR